MSHITQFRIDGLLGRTSPLEATLDRHINIFFGENGCGKTTLLRILAAALDRDGSIMEGLPVRRAEVHVYSGRQERVFKLVWDRDSINKPRAAAHKSVKVAQVTRSGQLEAISNIPWTIAGEGSEKVASGGWIFAFLPTNRLYSGPNELPVTNRFSTFQYDMKMGREDSLDKVFADALNRQWLQYYNKTLAEVRQVQEEGLRAVLRQVLVPQESSKYQSRVGLAVVHERVEHFLNRQKYPELLTLGSFEKFSQRYETDDNLRRIVDNLSNVERSIEEAMAPVSAFLGTVKKLFRAGKEIIQTDAELEVRLDSGESVSLAQLSSGEKHLLKILITAMNAGQNTIMIDEPELSMHIDWQRAFVSTVHSLNGNCQQILASHSPEVMADVADACIFRL